MTTDGYWNAQTESPGGGGVKIDGTTLVGQEDGDPDCHLTDPYCSHPFFDGIGASIRVTTDKANTYSSAACAAPGWLQTTEHITTSTNQILKDTTATQEQTVQYVETKKQQVAQTTQTTKTVTQITKTTTQYAKQKHHSDVEKYKVKESQDQTTMVRAQFQQQTIQNVAQTKQTQRVETTNHAYRERVVDGAVAIGRDFDAIPAEDISVPGRRGPEAAPYVSNRPARRRRRSARAAGRRVSSACDLPGRRDLSGHADAFRRALRPRPGPERHLHAGRRFRPDVGAHRLQRRPVSGRVRSGGDLQPDRTFGGAELHLLHVRRRTRRALSRRHRHQRDLRGRLPEHGRLDGLDAVHPTTGHQLQQPGGELPGRARADGS